MTCTHVCTLGLSADQEQVLTQLETPERESEIHRATEGKPYKKSEKGIKREVDEPTFKSLDKVPYSQYNYTQGCCLKRQFTHLCAQIINSHINL